MKRERGGKKVGQPPSSGPGHSKRKNYIRRTQSQCWSLCDKHGKVVLRSAMTENYLIYFPLEQNAVSTYSLPCETLGAAGGFWGIVQEHLCSCHYRELDKLVGNILQEDETPLTAFTSPKGIDSTLLWSEFRRCRARARCVFLQTQIILAFRLVLWFIITDLLSQTEANKGPNSKMISCGYLNKSLKKSLLFILFEVVLLVNLLLIISLKYFRNIIRILFSSIMTLIIFSFVYVASYCLCNY